MHGVPYEQALAMPRRRRIAMVALIGQLLGQTWNADAMRFED